MPEIIVQETPRAQQRHRTGHGHEYTPAATLEAQRRIRMAWTAKALPCFEGPVELVVWAFLPRPLGHFGTGRNASRLRPGAPLYPIGGRNDWDNLGKLVSDALSGVAYRNDGAIVNGVVIKRYAESTPFWRILVEDMESNGHDQIPATAGYR